MILAVTRINNDKYNFYKQHYKECVVGYEENSRSANNSVGLFRSSYTHIADLYEEMIDYDIKEIQKYRIQAILCVCAGVLVLVVGKKIAKKKEA